MQSQVDEAMQNVSSNCDNTTLLQVSPTVVLLVLVLGTLDLLIVGGNLLIIVAVLVNTKLQRCLTNHFVLSLAFSDLLLGVAVLPFSSVNLILDKQWIFGKLYCTVWLAVDVWLCTASILNLVAISFERYLAVRRPMSYTKYFTPRKVHVAIVAVWILAFLICLPSLFQNTTTVDSEPEDAAAFHHEMIAFSSSLQDNFSLFPNLKTSGNTSWTATQSQQVAIVNVHCVHARQECTIAESLPVYVVSSFCFSFLLPAVAMVTMYSRIYCTARMAMHNMQTGRIVAKGLKDGEMVTMRVHFGKRDSTVGLLALSAIGGVARQVSFISSTSSILNTPTSPFNPL